jgi:thiol reductant ABC exporter CydD subunit
VDAAAQATKEQPPPARRDRRGGPLDPRLLHYARTTRRFLVLAVAIGGATALLLIAQAWLIARIVAGAFLDHQTLGSLRGALLTLLAVIAGRSVLAWSAERTAHRASASAKSELRRAAAEKVAALGPATLEGSEAGRISTLLTTGIEALDGYFARYLPQLFLAVIVPIAVIAVVAGADWVSAVLIAVSLPLIPIFMALVGATTRDRTLARMRSLQKLAGHFLDVVAGLPTLKVFGRAKAQARAIADVTDRYRATTLATLRLTFLSSLVLELLATVSVALVAVAVGLRLLGGDMSFRDALFVLVLAPEAYLPLRALGANYHASADGMQAAQDVFTLLEQPADSPSGGCAKAADTSIRVRGLEVTYPGRRVPALDGAELVVAPGETVAVTGPSGCGKSTLLSVVLGLRVPDAGSVSLGGVDLARLDLDDWRSRIGWVPQRPRLFARSVAENVRLGRPDATDAAVAAALEAAGLTEVVHRLPQGADTLLGEGGAGLSAGERQRVSLARAFVRDAPLLLLDEPTAGLDGETEADVLTAVRRLVTGRTAVIVAHRPALGALADRVVALPPAVEVTS